MYETPTDNSPNRRARKWQTLGLMAGLMLATCFFLPAAQGCNAPVVPADTLFSEFIGTPAAADLPSLGNWALQCGVGLGMYFVAYVFGLFTAMGAAAGLARRMRLQQTLALGSATLLAYASAVLLISFASEAASNNAPWPTWPAWPSGDDWPLLLLFVVWPIVLGLLLILIKARRRQHWQRYCLLGGMTGLVWFGYFVIEVTAMYGLYLSLAACSLICIAAVGETAAITGRSFLRTLGPLLLCRPLRSIESRGHCPKCDYYLYGLTEQRCPECGRPFTFAEVNVTPVEIGFATPG